MSHEKYLKDRLSYRIPSLLPEYLRDESPAFEAFLKAYFEFLEAEVLVLESQSEIDCVSLEDGTGGVLYENATVSPSPDEDSSKILYEVTSANPDQNADPLKKGEYLVGNTSKSVAQIEVINGNTLYLKSISGNGFAKGETVTGRAGNQTAVVKSYKENSILASNRLLDYSDIDRTTEDFLDYFQQDFMPSIDLASIKNKRLTIKNIQDLYKKKGTAESIQFLMRILYQQDATIRHPIDETIHVGESGYSQQRRMRVTMTLSDTIPEANDKITQYDATGTLIEAQAVIENVYKDTGAKDYSLEIMNNHVGTFTQGSTVTILDRDGITSLTATVNGIVSDVTTGSSTYVDGVFARDGSGNITDEGDVLLEDGAGLLLETNVNPFGSLYSLNDQINITGSKLDTDTTETKSIVNGLTEGSIKEIMIEDGGQNYEAGDIVIFEDGVGGNAEAVIGSTGDEMLLEGGSVFGHYEITSGSGGQSLFGGPSVQDDNGNTIIFNDNQLDVYVNGLLKTPTTDYTWKNDRVQFTVAHGPVAAGALVELYTEYNRVTYEDGSVIDYNGVIHGGSLTSDDGRIRSVLIRDGGRYTSIPKVFPGGYIYLNDVSGFEVKETVTGGTSGATGIISRIDTENKRLVIKRLSTNTGVFAAPEVITGGTTGTTGTIVQTNVSSGTGAKLFAYSDNIGGVSSINITDQGNFFNYDGLVSGSSFYNILIKTPSANLLAKTVLTGTLSGTTATVVSYDADRHILTYKDLDGCFYDNEKVTFNAADSFYTIKSNNFDGRGLFAGEGIIEEQIVGDYGTLNANASRIQDGLLYQTHSYVVKVGESINKWRGIVKDLLHPAGHVVFGEVAIKNNVSSAMTSTFRPVIVITESVDAENYVASLYKRTIVKLYTLSSEVNDPFTILREAGQPAFNTDPRTGGSISSFAMVGGAQTGKGTEMYDSEMRSRHMNINVINSFASALVLNGARTGTPKVTHKVVTASSGEYFIDGIQNKTLQLDIGTTYDFSFPTAHPFKFSTTSDGTHNSGTEYTTGVTSGTGQVRLVTSGSTPTTLYYYCSIHSGMGGKIELYATNHKTSLNLANKDNDWLVIENERRPADKGRVIQLYTPSEEDLLLETGSKILDEPVPNYLRMDDRDVANVYHVGEFGERIISEDGVDLICLEDATTPLEVTHFVSERSIELESGGIYFEDGDRVVSETGQVFIQEDMSEVGITSYVPLGTTFRSLNTITGQQVYNIAYYLKDESFRDDAEPVFNKAANAVSNSTTVTFGSAIDDDIEVGDEVLGTNLTDTAPRITAIAGNKLSITLDNAITIANGTVLKFIDTDDKIGLEDGTGAVMSEESKPEGLRIQDLTEYYPTMFLPEFKNQERKRTNITYSAYIKSA